MITALLETVINDVVSISVIVGVVVVVVELLMSFNVAGLHATAQLNYRAVMCNNKKRHWKMTIAIIT